MTTPRDSSLFSLSVRHIVDIPDEIMMEVLHVNARDRAIMSNYSHRFNRIVFQDGKLMRDLNFSHEGRLALPLHIRQYFNNEKLHKYILKVNVRNVNCIEPRQMLNDYIGKALNLVDINIHGIELEDVWQLGSFLNPLIFVEKLSVHWPITAEKDDVADYNEFRQVLNKLFSRLRCLSVKTRYYRCLWKFIQIVDRCQELKELHIEHGCGANDGSGLAELVTELGKLEIFEFCGDSAFSFKESAASDSM